MAVAEIRAALPAVVAIYRFGSSVDGVRGLESDADLAVLSDLPLDAVVRFDLQERRGILDRIGIEGTVYGR